MKETPYIVQVDSKGVQRLCLSDGTPIPLQIESCCTQTTEQSKIGLCTYSVLIFIEKEHATCATGGATMLDNWSIKLPNGTICDVDHVSEFNVQGTPAAYLTVTARLKPTDHANDA